MTRREFGALAGALSNATPIRFSLRQRCRVVGAGKFSPPKLKLGSFREKVAGQFSSLLLWRLSKAHTWSATVLIDELDAGSLQRALYLVSPLRQALWVGRSPIEPD
jgi:hypothetical protein